MVKTTEPHCTDQLIIEAFQFGFLLVFFGSGLLIFLLEGPREIKLWLDHQKGRAILRKS